MSVKTATPRKAGVTINYTPKGKKTMASSVVGSYLQSFTYTDCAAGESDTAEISLDNTDLKWANTYLPKKGDKFTAKLTLYSWDKEGVDISFNCGTFCCDDREISGWPCECTVNGLSSPENQALRSTERSKTWKNVTVKEIARQIAKRYNLQLLYYASTVKVTTLEQSKKDDASFLNSLCEDYGFNFKIYAGKIIIYNPTTYEAKNAVKTYSIKDLLDYHYNSTMVGTYTGATIKYTSGKGKKKKEYTCKVGYGTRLLTINEKVDNINDAKLKATAALKKENRKAVTMTATFPGDTKLVAGNCITIKDGYEMNGKYFISKATHKVTAEGAYTVSVEMYKTNVKAAASAPAAKAPTPAPVVYKKGDKVIVNGRSYYSSNGGRSKNNKNKKMYIIKIVSGKKKYPYSISKRKGGKRYGYVAKSSLKKA